VHNDAPDLKVVDRRIKKIDVQIEAVEKSAL
jgi:hypothetical protein